MLVLGQTDRISGGVDLTWEMCSEHILRRGSVYEDTRLRIGKLGHILNKWLIRAANSEWVRTNMSAVLSEGPLKPKYGQCRRLTSPCQRSPTCYTTQCHAVEPITPERVRLLVFTAGNKIQKSKAIKAAGISPLRDWILLFNRTCDSPNIARALRQMCTVSGGTTHF